MPIYGFHTKTEFLPDLLKKLDSVQKDIQKDADRKYHELLGKEIAMWTDLSTLNLVKLPEDISIFEHSVRTLAAKLLNAGAGEVYGAYNFQVYAHIVSYDHETYINVLCAQTDFLTPFKKEFLPCYVLDGIEENTANKKNIENGATWKKIEQVYKGRKLMGIDLTPKFEPDIEKVKYPSLQERCEIQARHQIINAIIAKMNGNDSIPPYLLMPCIDTALDIYLTKELQMEQKIKKMHLAGILIDLNKNKSSIVNTVKEYNIPLDNKEEEPKKEKIEVDEKNLSTS